MMSALVIDDDAANRDVFTRVLSKAGFEVTAAENGIAALTTLSQRSFHAIMCDIRMPELSGKGFFEQLEETYPDMAARVVFVTAYADDPNLGEFLRNSGQPVLHKPVELHALVTAAQEMAARSMRKSGEGFSR